MGTEEKGTAGVRRGGVWEVGQRGSTRDKHYLGSRKDRLVRVARREKGSGRRRMGRECPAQEGKAGGGQRRWAPPGPSAPAGPCCRALQSLRICLPLTEVLLWG